MIPFVGKLLGNPWVLIGIAITCFGAGAYTAHQFSEADKVDELRAQLKTQADAYAKRDAEHAERMLLDSALMDENAKLRDENSKASDRLKAATVNRIFTVREAPTDAQPCPVTTRGPDYRLCFNAAVSGDSAAIAACEAGGGHATVQGSELVPSPGVVR